MENDDVLSITPELLANFGLDEFEPVFHTGKYGCNVYYKLNPETISQYAKRFRKTDEWIGKQYHDPTLFFYKKL